MFKLYEQLSNDEIQKLKKINHTKKTEKMSKRDWLEIMGVNRPKYKRVRGAIRRK
ncbi:hypothetical protein [Paranoxybacillus vitaminiphilus]|uniref:hypothetical protein n=1 Tax=Paranoxybacillus vitaminiphilus TaxID=581036 RepID=UPI0015EC9C69|nr:hypothetical protein [Anoxybacillus vitaminiphilus]